MHTVRIHGQRQIASIIDDEQDAELMRRLPQRQGLRIRCFHRSRLVPVLKYCGAGGCGSFQHIEERTIWTDRRIQNDIEACQYRCAGILRFRNSSHVSYCLECSNAFCLTMRKCASSSCRTAIATSQSGTMDLISTASSKSARVWFPSPAGCSFHSR